jgi:hypothetical protein
MVPGLRRLLTGRFDLIVNIEVNVENIKRFMIATFIIGGIALTFITCEMAEMAIRIARIEGYVSGLHPHEKY